MRLAHARLTEIIESAGYDPAVYSGRGMYGARCVSLSTDDGDMEVAANLAGAAEDVDEAAAVLRGITTDSMGLGTVFYWRGVPWPGADGAKGGV